MTKGSFFTNSSKMSYIFYLRKIPNQNGRYNVK